MGEKAGALDARCISALVNYRQRLVDSINISSIVDHLIAKGVVSQQEYETLSLPNLTDHQKAQYLIDILSNGSRLQFNTFVALLYAHVNKELASCISNYQVVGEQWSDDIVRKALVKGQVPIFAKITARPEKLELIRRGLRNVRSLQDYPLLVLLVQGMGGSGKTVLASEAVRCAPLMAECFPNGIIWKSAGHMRGLEEAELKRAIHDLLRTILAHPVLCWKPRYDGQKLQEITSDQLDAEISHLTEHMKLLLVLDDVWQQDVLIALKNVPILVLATSRNRAIVDMLPAHIDVTAMKCTKQEARCIVTSHCGSVDEGAMKELLKRCDGLPLALAIWASVLKDKPHQEQRKIASAPSKDILVGEFQALLSGYECLADALEASILQLEREIKKKERLGELLMLSGADLSNLYLDIAALDDDEDLFVSKLVPVWNKSTNLTRRLLEVLADRNLLTRTGKKRGEEEYFSDRRTKRGEKEDKEDLFTIHDVQLDFLRALVRSREGGTLNVRCGRWIGGFLKNKNKLSDLLVAWENLENVLYFEELWRIVRDFEEDEREKYKIQRRTACWQRSMKPAVTLYQQWDKVPNIQRELFTFLLYGVSHSGWNFLHQAALEGHVVTAESLPPLLHAFPCLNIHAATTERTLVDNYEFNSGIVPLHAAAASGQVEAVKALLDREADIEAKDNSNMTPLHWASYKGQLETTKALLDRKADIEAKGGSDMTPLQMASVQGNVDVVNALLNCKANIEAKGGSNLTPLQLASVQGNVEVVNILLNCKANIEATSDKKHCRRPLHLACLKGHVEVVNALLDHKADIEAKNKAKQTPLHVAILNDKVEVVRVLVQRRANVDTAWRGRTPTSMTSNKDIKALLQRTNIRENGQVEVVNAERKEKRNSIIEKNGKKEGCDRQGMGVPGGKPDDAREKTKKTVKRIANSDETITVGTITYNPKIRLGRGSSSDVYKGTYDGNEVAVKILNINDVKFVDREVESLKIIAKDHNHQNIIRYFNMESTSDSYYIALELCQGTLVNYVKPDFDQGSLDAIKLLQQTTDGLAYLHKNLIVHRDVKPSNVLISRGMHGPTRAMLSDFGLCKILVNGQETFSRGSGTPGTIGWTAPEMLTNKNATNAVDIFCLGLVFYYVLSNGKHPFGIEASRQDNISNGVFTLDALNHHDESFRLQAKSIITKMIDKDPTKRPPATETMEDPIFWLKEKKLQFFLDVNLHIDQKNPAEEKLPAGKKKEKRKRLPVPAVIDLRNRLDLIGKVFEDNWLKNLDEQLRINLTKGPHPLGKGDEKSLCELLRAMRNKHQHYAELSPEIKALLGNIPDGFVTYFMNRFPKLLNYVYDCIKDCNNETFFPNYFAIAS